MGRGLRRRLLLLLLWGIIGVASDRPIHVHADEGAVSVQMADGTTRELTAAEFEALVQARADEQANGPHKNDKTLVADDVTRWQRQELEQLETQDPSFALHIDLARRAFQEIQRHGYAQGYALSGFSEQETGKGGTANEYYVELVLQATSDPTTGRVAKTGTGTRKKKRAKEGHELPLRYEVQLLLDTEKRFSVVAAWELSDKEPPRGQRRARVMLLSIQPTVALLERETKRARSRPAVMIWLLAGGLGLVAAGVLIMYNTRNPIPAPKPRRRSSDVWELVDKNDKPVKKADKSNKKND